MKMINYARALHRIAIENDKLDRLTYEFQAFKDELSSYDLWFKMMDSPMISLDEKYAYIDAFAFDASFLAFLKLLARNTDMQLYDEIHEQWLYLARNHQKIAHIHLYSAKPISDDEIKQFEKVLSPRFQGKTISFHVTIDEGLLGGIKTIYHGQSLDRSVAKELEELYTLI